MLEGGPCQSYNCQLRIKAIVYSNTWRISKDVIARDWHLQIAAMLHPPMPSYDYIDDWLLKLAENAKPVEVVLEYATTLSSEANESYLVSAPTGDLLDHDGTVEIAAMGL